MEKTWPQLYAKASTGKIKTWKTWVVGDNQTNVIIWTRYGYIDGKLTDKAKPVKNGKNIGKSNETTPFEQACIEAQSAHNRKIDKKYITEIPNDDNEPDIYLPMLAKNFKKYSHHIKYPCLGQPKLNGVRCMAKKISETQINYTSRKGKSYNDTLGHLTKYLLPIMKIDEIFDGEIYRHDWSFQQIVRRVKKVRNDTDRLQFWVYDVANDMPTVARSNRYFDAIDDNFGCIKPLHTLMITSEEEVYQYHNIFVQKGFEGIILRNVNTDYKFDHRSMDLQKYKEFIDSEFEIIAAESEIIIDTTYINNEQLAVIWVCRIENGETFNVRPKGSNEQRVKWYSDRAGIIGKKLTVRYQELSEDGIPIFPVGIAIRDYE